MTHPTPGVGAAGVQDHPLVTRCDFCGATTTTNIWNSRTCRDCAAAGAPDQGALPWKVYEGRLLAWLRARGKRRNRTPAQVAASDLARMRPGMAKSVQDGHSSRKPAGGQKPASGPRKGFQNVGGAR